MVFLAYMLEILAKGQRLPYRYDGTAIDADSVMGRILQEQGVVLPFTAALVWSKGDLDELPKTLGLPSVSRLWDPCFNCHCAKHNMHSHYHNLAIDETPWDPVADDEYDQFCRDSEHHVLLETEEDRQLIVLQGGLVYVKDGKARGLTLSQPVPRFHLCAGDWLQPSMTLLDVGDFHTCNLPVVITFWRPQYDAEGHRVGLALHHNPIFDMARLGTSPSRLLAIDALHTLYLGPMGT